MLAVLALSCVSCNLNSQQTTTPLTTELTDTASLTPTVDFPPFRRPEPYKTNFKTKIIDSNTIELIVNLELLKGNVTLHPYFSINTNNTDLKCIGDFVKVSQSKDPTSIHRDLGCNDTGGIKIRYTYKQKLQLNTKGNFKIPARIEYVVDTNTGQQVIPVILNYENGVLTCLEDGC